MEQSSWETQRPIDQAATNKENLLLKKKYEELLDLHADLISAMFVHDNAAISRTYNRSLFSNMLARFDIDSTLKSKISVPSFLKC